MKVVETCDCCDGKGILPDDYGTESGCFNCNGTGTLKYDTDDAPADEEKSESPTEAVVGPAADGRPDSTAVLEGKHRYFGIWFGWNSPIKARTKRPVTCHQLKDMMDKNAVSTREGLSGKMVIEPLTKHQFYAPY